MLSLPGPRFDPGWETKILQATKHSQKKKKENQSKKRKRMNLHIAHRQKWGMQQRVHSRHEQRQKGMIVYSKKQVFKISALLQWS